MDNLKLRLDQSIRTLAAYEAGGLASMENLRIFREEMATLDALAFAHPERAAQIVQLRERWQLYVSRCKLGK